MIDTAVSAGVRAPRSSPVGPWYRSIAALVESLRGQSCPSLGLGVVGRGAHRHNRPAAQRRRQHRRRAVAVVVDDDDEVAGLQRLGLRQRLGTVGDHRRRPLRQVGLRDEGVAESGSAHHDQSRHRMPRLDHGLALRLLAGDMAAGLGEERLGCSAGGLVEHGRAQAALDRLAGPVDLHARAVERRGQRRRLTVRQGVPSASGTWSSRWISTLTCPPQVRPARSASSSPMSIPAL